MKPDANKFIFDAAKIGADGHPLPAQPENGSATAPSSDSFADAEAAKDPLPFNDDPPEPTAPQPPAAKSLGDLKRRTVNDPNELLRTGYVCRGGGVLLAAPTGIGKSSWAMQAMILWAIGRACFGITPTRPLKSLLIQAENDDGDLAEMRDGVIAGMDLTDEEKTDGDRKCNCRPRKHPHRRSVY